MGKLKEEVVREAARLNGLSREDHLKEVKKRLVELSKKIKQFEKEKKKLENEEQKLQKDVKRRGEVETLHKNLPQMDLDLSKVVQFGQHLVIHKTRQRPTKKEFRLLKQFKAEANTIVDVGKSQTEKETRRRCYMCHKKNEKKVDSSTCLGCSNLNKSMREARIDLTGRFAIVTGGRVKIGLEVALRLLRDGCTVIATSRFPSSAMRRYSFEPDYTTWSHRLQIFGLDLQDLGSILKFVEFAKSTVPHLDILINNAAQTLWRPSQFYRDVLDYEASQADRPHPSVHPTPSIPSLSTSAFPCDPLHSQSESTSDDLNANENCRKKLCILPPADSQDCPCFFPPNLKDEEGQQIDLRPSNSWTSSLGDVPLQELLQALSINSVAPFLLVSRLKPLLLRSPHARKFVVNVSAMEGQFGRATKGHCHPHTNMAKAALNMLTRTSGLELKLDGIYMSAVDTGWCTDERPEKEQRGFEVPLTCEDGAARVYHPLLHGLQTDKTPDFAVFLKDFKPHPW